MIKQRLGQIEGRFCELAIYTTGETGWYLFKPLQQISPGTFVESAVGFAYHGRQLKPGWKRKLH